MHRDTPLAEAHAIAQSQLDNDIQTQAADKAAVASAQAVIEAAQAQRRLHQGPLADRRRRRTGHAAGRQSGQHQFGAYFGVAAESDQGLLLHQRTGVPGALSAGQVARQSRPAPERQLDSAQADAVQQPGLPTDGPHHLCRPRGECADWQHPSGGRVCKSWKPAAPRPVRAYLRRDHRLAQRRGRAAACRL